ncbi:MAG: hypothetical protein CMJ48_07285 [Planctomycetaceae bacterium]|nr:hypothetical protein [Planctomycetaceae bacterium]
MDVVTIVLILLAIVLIVGVGAVVAWLRGVPFLMGVGDTFIAAIVLYLLVIGIMMWRDRFRS